MSVELVTLAEAKGHLRIVDSDGDADLTLKIRAASGAVLNYLKSGADVFLDSSGQTIPDSSGDPVVPDVVKLATLYLIGTYDRDRDGGDAPAVEPGYPPAPVVALLYPLRDPACL